MGNNKEMIQDFEKDMMKTFKMINLGLMHYFLGIEISQENEEIFISQKKYTESLLKKFQMTGYKAVATPFMTNEKLQKEDGLKKKGHINIQKFNKKLTISNNNKTKYNVCNKSTIKVHAKSKPKIHFGAVKRTLRYL
jgi:hypothetical protein